MEAPTKSLHVSAAVCNKFRTSRPLPNTIPNQHITLDDKQNNVERYTNRGGCAYYRVERRGREQVPISVPGHLPH